MHVGWIQAKVENVLLGESQVFDELPGTVLETGRARPALLWGEAVYRLVEANVRLFPIKQLDERFAQGDGRILHQLAITTVSPISRSARRPRSAASARSARSMGSVTGSRLN